MVRRTDIHTNDPDVTRTIPDELQGISIDIDSASDIHNKRYLFSFNYEGKQLASAVPDGACVMTIEQSLKAINEPNGIYVETDMLADFAIETIKRLKRRLSYYATKDDSKQVDKTTAAMDAVLQAVQS